MALRTECIAVDTNVLLSAAVFRTDPLDELRGFFGKNARIVVPRQVLEEIEKISRRKKRFERQAFVARALLEKHCIKPSAVKAKGADAALLALARKGFAIATNDRALRKKILGMGKKAIVFSRGRVLEKNS